ncbi:hypothetical protein Pth03_37230 [Planotetraspora thailandica]|uniref:RlpA-like protein double-psi beta-barrel domain-containing protein n=1 Tax=Planotetraspora thailandica TaxID=487172 RepID=A0A8J3V7B4_9ACTN|nr:hypothetical protein [Planotetraspora thailandica]GII55334.1 hypothetical protein Pth03_37230 [Planotetraspora thailandica]
MHKRTCQAFLTASLSASLTAFLSAFLTAFFTVAACAATTPAAQAMIMSPLPYPAASAASPSPAPSPAQAAPSPAPHLPSGTATATSFWDSGTASGLPMSYETIASPYWPLGTRVRISYEGRSAVGVVQDFGPAEWAVAQHDIPAIVDLSEKMMAGLTGARSNSVHVKFQVLSWGTGRVYRHSGTGYDLAMGRG